jgi:hypothetical protein
MTSTPKSYISNLKVPICYDDAGKVLDSVVMTTWAKSIISHGLICTITVGR